MRGSQFYVLDSTECIDSEIEKSFDVSEGTWRAHKDRNSNSILKIVKKLKKEGVSTLRFHQILAYACTRHLSDTNEYGKETRTDWEFFTPVFYKTFYFTSVRKEFGQLGAQKEE